MKTRCLVVVLLTTLACNGGSNTGGTGGKATGGTGGGAGGSTGGAGGAPRDGGTTDGPGPGGAGGQGGAPTMAQTRRLVGGRARLVGGPVSACSQPAGNADKWCAFTLPAAMPIGATELWVINASKGITADIPCDGSNPACLKLTGTLWTGAPAAGVIHPFAHRFDGETLIFHANAAVNTQAFNGPIFAWRPGWPKAEQLSGPNASSCEAHPLADSALCLENVRVDLTPPYLDVTAGKVKGTPLPLASRIYPSTPMNAKQWNIAFSPAGDHFAYSTGGATEAEKETLHVWKIDEVGMAAKKVTVGAFAEWSISGDGKHWYYLRDYNYPPRNSGIIPSGTLMRADFPGGGNPTLVATAIAAYLPLEAGNVDRGVAFMDGVAGGKGNYKLIRNPAKPTEVVTLATGVLGWEVSPDLRYSLLQTQVAAGGDVGDAIIIKNDGTGRCPLAMGTTAAAFGSSFFTNAGRVFWADNVNPMTLEGEGWMANPDGCTEKHKFGDKVDFWFLAGDAGVIFSDAATTNNANLKYMKLGPGQSFVGATTIRNNVGRVYAPLGSDRNYVVFQIADGGPEDGLYIHGPLGF